ncbi:hypothetical protein IZY60_01765 [Lutibacter sp. B2]|nr:hypothetical protein [Lutibacter sp. B2]
MRITCEPIVDMGYIYLQKPKKYKYVQSENMEIPILGNDLNILERINHLKISKISYANALNKGELGEEFQNDMDEKEYLIGVELTLTKEDFMNNIKEKNYKVYNINWKNKEFTLVTLDKEEEVFSEANILYPANKNKDVFYIVNKGDYGIGYIKGLLSSRADLYQLEYLSQPDFVLYE